LQEQDGREEEDDGGLQLVSILCRGETERQRDRREREGNMKASATAIKSPRCGTPPCEGTVAGGNQSIVL